MASGSLISVMPSTPAMGVQSSLLTGSTTYRDALSAPMSSLTTDIVRSAASLMLVWKVSPVVMSWMVLQSLYSWSAFFVISALSMATAVRLAAASKISWSKIENCPSPSLLRHMMAPLDSLACGATTGTHRTDFVLYPSFLSTLMSNLSSL